MRCNNIFLNAIHNNTVKQFLEIVAIYPYWLSGLIMLKITVKDFNFQITVVVHICTVK